MRTALVEALADLPGAPGVGASPGTVLWVTDGPARPPILPAPLRAEPVDAASLEAGGQPPVQLGRAAAGCVFDGTLDGAADPAWVLGWAYRSLRPGGRLAVSVSSARDAGWRGRRPAAAIGDGASPPTSRAEGLRALLFREGFEEPRLRRVGAALVVSARRSALLPPPERTHRLSVIMPVYNEAATFDTTIAQVLAKEIPGVEIDVVIVESNSTDGSRERVLLLSDHPRVRVILEDRPRGKGHAVRAGLKAARGDFILIQDADTEYDVDDYDALLEPLRACEVGFVLGVRENIDGSWGLRDFRHNRWTSHLMNVGHVGFLALFNTVYGQRLQDPFTMYKVMRRDCLHGLVFECNRFDFDWELTAKLVRAGYHPREIPVTYRSRSFAEGKKIAFVRDPLTWVRACIKYRFVRLYPRG